MRKYSKAIAATVAAFGAVLGEAVTDVSKGGVLVTREEWVTAIVAAVVAGVATFAAPRNTPA